MPKLLTLKTFLPDREVAICRRFRDARIMQRRGQPELARELGITRARLASYEYCKAPIRYDVADKLCSRFNLCQRWLAVGEGLLHRYVKLPPEVASKINPRELFSKAFDERLESVLSFDLVQSALAVKDVTGYASMIESEFAFLEEHGIHLDAKAIAEIKQSLAVVADLVNDAEKHAGNKTELTDVILVGNNPDVKPTWPAFLKRINKAAAERGMKSRLAKHMGVKLPNVSQWLSGDKEPSGETTLRLLHWVEQQERQQTKSPGSALTPPGPKTRSTRSMHEKVKPSPPKR